MPDKEYLTKEKYVELEKELHELEKVKRKEIAERLEYARSLGDLSENAEYHDARSEQAEVESRIEKIYEVLKHAEIVTHHKSDIVIVGSVVTTAKVGSKDETTYTVVGSEEVDPDTNKISHQSPLGSSMIGKKVGDKFHFKTPKGSVEYKITGIK